MNQSKNDLNYVNQILETAQQNPSPRLTYLLWAAIILIGFGLADYKSEWVSIFWMVAAPLGMIASALIAIQTDNKLGQKRTTLGINYFKHMLLMVLTIFVAAYTNNTQSILLIIGLAYCLGGLYLDKKLFWVGLISYLAHFLVFLKIIQSNFLIGIIISLGILVTAFAETNTIAKSQ